jgi:hypothetical protein
VIDDVMHMMCYVFLRFQIVWKLGARTCKKSVPFRTLDPVSLRRWISFGMLSRKGFGLLIKSIE